MKDYQHRISSIRYQLKKGKKSKNGKRYVIKSLSDKERDELKNVYVVEPWIYRVELNFPLNFRITENTEWILKDLFIYKKSKKRPEKFTRLSKSQHDACKRIGLKTRVAKYRITFISNSSKLSSI